MGGELELVRVVLLTGSRGSGRSIDELSDYDVMVYVSDVAALLVDSGWMTELGSVLVRLPVSTENEWSQQSRMRLVIYEDGTKIDFMISPVDLLAEVARAERLPAELDAGYIVLLDKDGTTAMIAAPTGAGYMPSAPSQSEFHALVEEFWWESTYVARNLRRGELLPAKYSFDCVMKLDLLRRMLEWRAEIDCAWTVRPGVLGRGLRRLVQPQIWDDLERTFVGADIGENWHALSQTMILFRRVAVEVARGLRLEYPHALDARVWQYVIGIHTGSPDAVQKRD